MEHMSRINQFVDEVAAPVLNQMVDEGLLMGRGQAVHAWGDEWNSNNYFVVENIPAFFTAWSEYKRRLNAASPGWAQEMVSLCDEHKDNFYTLRNGR